MSGEGTHSVTNILLHKHGNNETTQGVLEIK